MLSGRSLLSLYNGLVLPHLQYCLMVWGNFEACRNKGRGEELLRLQKRYVGIMAGKRGLYHADPLFFRFGVLKVGDLYRQQLRLHGWKCWNGRLPPLQAAMFQRVEERHSYGTRAARGGLALGMADHRSVSFGVPAEWATLSEEDREARTLAAFKRRSRASLLAGYGEFVCGVVGCRVCA